VLAATGSAWFAVGRSCSLSVAGWSPDDRKIAVVRWFYPVVQQLRGRHRQRRRQRAAYSALPLETDQDGDFGISWAPDGRSIVYQHYTEVGGRRSSVIRFELATCVRRVIGAGTDPSFGPHGLMYISQEGIVVGGRILVGDDGRRLVSGWHAHRVPARVTGVGPGTPRGLQAPRFTGRS